MPVTSAINHYLGKAGHARVNCAQAILSAFREKFNLDDGVVQQFKTFGGGNAPDGLCGAFYAVKYLSEKNIIREIDLFKEEFKEQAGSTKCKEIKMLKRFSCLDCIAKCAEFLADSGVK
jgi:hypothetical protein